MFFGRLSPSLARMSAMINVARRLPTRGLITKVQLFRFSSVIQSQKSTFRPLLANRDLIRPCQRLFHSTRVIANEKAEPINEKPINKKPINEKPMHDDVMSWEARHGGEISTARKVVEAGKDVSYAGLILLGAGLTAVFIYSLFGELLGGTSTNALFSKTLKKVIADERVKELLGDNIKGFGEENGRGRRRHIASQEYEVKGEVYVRMQFYCQGKKEHGTVHVEVHKVGRKFEYRYLYVEVPGQGLPSEVVVLEDNR